MSELLDYIVFMTYDLHGQWDAGKEWGAKEWGAVGCPTGSCLRSHINRTETMSALTMITKAGVPSNKVLVGVSSYGRSFQMADPSCTGPNCFFTGTPEKSNARKGRCTNEGGYLANAEIDEMLGSARTWMDVDSNSRIMVDGDLWVAYMDDDLKASRTQMYKRYNMGGTIDWAVDLAKFHDPPYGISAGVDLGSDWKPSKGAIQSGGGGAVFVEMVCETAMLKRTGDWVDMVCTQDENPGKLLMTPSERWEGMDCQHGWEDAVRVYKACYKGDHSFSLSIATFLQLPGSVSENQSLGRKGCGD